MLMVEVAGYPMLTPGLVRQMYHAYVILQRSSVGTSPTALRLIPKVVQVRSKLNLGALGQPLIPDGGIVLPTPT